MSLDDDLRSALSAMVRPETPAATDAAWQQVRADARARRRAHRRSRLVLGAACLLALAMLAGAAVLATAGTDEARVGTDVAPAPTAIDPANARALTETTVALTDALAREWLTTAEARAGVGVGSTEVAADRQATDDAAVAWHEAVARLADAGVDVERDGADELGAARAAVDAGAPLSEVSDRYGEVIDLPARALVASARATADPGLAAELLVVDGLAGRLHGRAAVGAAFLDPGANQLDRVTTAQRHQTWSMNLADEHSPPAWKQQIRDGAARPSDEETINRGIEAMTVGQRPADLDAIVAACEAALAADAATAATLAAQVANGATPPPTWRAEATELLRSTLEVQRLLDDDRAAAFAAMGSRVGTDPGTGAPPPELPTPGLEDAIVAWEQAATAFEPHAAATPGDDILSQTRTRLDGLATIHAWVVQGPGSPPGDGSVKQVATTYASLDGDLSAVARLLASHIDGAAVVDGDLVAALDVERGMASELAELAVDEALATRQGTGDAHEIGPYATWLIDRHGTPAQRAALERFDAGPPTTAEVREVLTVGQDRRWAELEGRGRDSAGPAPDAATLWEWWAARRAAVAELSAVISGPLDD